MSLYLQYRPKSFTDMVWQRHVMDILIAQAKQNQLWHGYILYWPRGTGKTSTARILAKIANCTTFTADWQPDLFNDPAAKLIDSNSTIDFVEIDAASHTGVDNIRDEIIDKVAYAPAHLKKKVYVIDEVHMLSKGAFNALLKIMEEPPEYIMFILATTELHKVPETILSRCQVFNFKQLSIDEISWRLDYIAKSEKIDADPAALRLIAKLSWGAMRDAIKYLEQISILWPVTEDNVAKFLGVVNDRLLNDWIELLRNNDINARIVFLDSLVQQGVDLQNFAKELLVRLDEHFIENPSLYSSFAGMIEEIIANAKWYPHPLLIRKATSRKWFGEKPSESIPVVKQQPISTPPATQTPPVWTIQEPVQTVIQSPQEPIPTETPIVENTITAATPEQIIEALVAGSSNPFAKSILKQSVIIQEVTAETIWAIVINEQSYHTISKAELSHDLEKILQKAFGFSGNIKRAYMSKEERLLKSI
jgi:DNA polymerase III subunit gamma/tau